MRRSVRSLAAVAAVAALGLAACSGGTNSSSSADAEQTYGPGALPTVTEGKLTVATSDPAYSPWILNNDPALGEGYESAVIYALAEELGYSADNVQWVRATFESSITPGAKDWDLNIQQFSITDERRNAVDFTSPYYTTSEAIIAKAGTPAADAKSIADLKDVLIGVQAGTTSQQFASDTLEPGLSQKLQMFNSSDDTVLALQTGRVDAVVVDLPTAFNMIATQVDNGVVVGQFADAQDGENYGIVLPKGSKLTPTVSAAVDRLAESGKLDELQEKWLNEAQNVPILK
ncbi:MAG: amino acid ABC transporter substrate-binding protein [Actinomyces sp.]|nr:amino acid ABC transporter substrate-binding protein [Actinomyces sp.]